MPRLFRTWATAFVGLLLLQAVWLLVVPVLQGIDEHDHVFKAAAVARGDWRSSHEKVAVGRGELLAVPRDIAEAARPACQALRYTRRDDCLPSEELADGRVLIGSAAARYNPVFYAVAGTAALPFDGRAAVYAMRIAAAIWCAALVALAITVVRRTARTPWPAAALVAAVTPTMLYAGSIPAPNGVEMAAGLLLWCALLFGATDDLPAPGWVVAAGTAAAIHLAVLRSMGPLWLALVLGTAALVIGIPAFLRVARTSRLRLPILGTGLALVGGIAWTLTSGTNSPAAEPGPEITHSPWPKMFTNWLAWVLQQMSAAPSRNDAAPTVVYVLVAAVWLVLLALALRAAPGRVRLALVAVFALVSAMAISITVLSFSDLGYAWQGRYAWPYVVGWLVLAGWVLDRSRTQVRGARGISLGAGAAMATALVVVALDVADGFTTRGPALSGGWSPPHPLVVCGLVATGMVLLLVALLRATSARQSSPDIGAGREAGREALIG